MMTQANCLVIASFYCHFEFHAYHLLPASFFPSFPSFGRYGESRSLALQLIDTQELHKVIRTSTVSAAIRRLALAVFMNRPSRQSMKESERGIGCLK